MRKNSKSDSLDDDDDDDDLWTIKTRRNKVIAQDSNKKSKSPNTQKMEKSDFFLDSIKYNRPLIDDPFCIQNRKFLFLNQNFSIFDDDELNKMLGHLREYSSYCAMHRGYDEAKASDKLFDQIQIELIQRSIPKSNNDEINESFQVQKNQELERLDNELKDFDIETLDKRESLLRKHMDEASIFERIWRDEKPPKYRKASKRLLFLLASEKRCARIGQYDEAKRYQLEAEKLIEIETKSSQDALNNDYKIAKSNFLHKQEEELRIFNEYRNEQRDLILAKRALILEAIGKRENILRDRASQIPKTENKHFSEYMLQAGGNVAKVMYDDHITTFENPIPELKPPNSDVVLGNEEMKKKEMIEHQGMIKKRMTVKDQIPIEPAIQSSTSSNDSKKQKQLNTNSNQNTNTSISINRKKSLNTKININKSNLSSSRLSSSRLSSSRLSSARKNNEKLEPLKKKPIIPLLNKKTTSTSTNMSSTIQGSSRSDMKSGRSSDSSKISGRSNLSRQSLSSNKSSSSSKRINSTLSSKSSTTENNDSFSFTSKRSIDISSKSSSKQFFNRSSRNNEQLSPELSSSLASKLDSSSAMKSSKMKKESDLSDESFDDSFDKGSSSSADFESDLVFETQTRK